MKFLFRSLFFVIFDAAGFFDSVFTSSLPDDSQAHVPAKNMSEEQSVAIKTTQDQFWKQMESNNRFCYVEVC
jgi:hypothetical protein